MARKRKDPDGEFRSGDERESWKAEQKELQRRGKPQYRFNHTPTDADVVRSEKKDMRSYDKWAEGRRREEHGQDTAPRQKMKRINNSDLADRTQREFKKKSTDSNLRYKKLKKKGG